MKPDILVVGSMNMDLVMYVPKLPSVGETILGTEFRETPGGKGGNQAAAAAQLGAKTALIAKIGDDERGRTLKECLEGFGVGVRHVTEQPGCASGAALVCVEPSGANFIAVATGANTHLAPQDVDQAEELFATAKVMLVQLEIPISTVVYAIEKARTHNIRVVLDPSPALSLPQDLLKQVDVITPNEVEARILLGHAPRSVDLSETRGIAKSLKELGASHVVLKLGRHGAWISDSDLDAHVPAFEVESLDTTAAGDVFNSALAVAMCEGSKVAESVRFANCAAALSTTKPGAQSSIPSRREVDSLFSAQIGQKQPARSNRPEVSSSS
ncbi:MAG: ribokinase [Acidobacteria bacterium]|nr:ribokinase [Acidobacteriota bacterium]